MCVREEAQDLLKLVSHFPQARIAVVGDMAADVYVYGKPYKLSREAPVVVIRYQTEEFVPGSAANTANNLLALGAQVLPVGIVGVDGAGRRLRDHFHRRGAETSGLFDVEGHQTPTKTRILAGDYHTSKQQVIRIDRESDPGISPEVEEKVLASLEGIREEIDGLIISDYGYELVTPRVIQWAQELARKKVVVVDSHYRLREFAGVTLITPNEPEAEKTAGFRIRNEEDTVRAGRLLLSEVRSQAVLITRGNQGMILFERDGPVTQFPIWGRDDVIDVTGAGDTVASVCALVLSCKGSFPQAARLANYAGGIVVTKRGTATLTREELAQAVVEDFGPGK